MKKVLILTLLFITSFCYAQEKEKDFGIYVIISYSDSYDNTNFTVNIDDGKSVDYYRDEKGKKVSFRTVAAALTYFESLGWTLCKAGSSLKGGGSFTFWLFKKPVSKEEYEEYVNNAIKKE